jgi:hypothetical protein
MGGDRAPLQSAVREGLEMAPITSRRTWGEDRTSPADTAPIHGGEGGATHGR